MTEHPKEAFEQYPLPTGSLPSSWRVAYIGEFADDVSPGFASGQHTSDGVGVPHLRPMNVDRDGMIDLSVVKSVVGSKRVELQANDVLFNNTNSAELIGKTAVASTQHQGFAFSNHMTRIRVSEGVAAVYVARHLHFLWMTGYLRHRCTNHVNQASISSRTLANTVPVFFPPAAEQTRIVEKLEELLSDLDAGVAELKAAQKKLVQYRQSLLKAAVEGALTAEWRAQRRSPDARIRVPVTNDRNAIQSADGGLRNPDASIRATEDETGAQLLARILKERRARWEAKQLAKFAEQGKAPPKGWQDKYPEPVKPDTTDLPTLPEGWVWSSIGQCFYVGVGATPSRKEATYWGGDVLWVSSGEVRFNRIVDTKEKISREGLKNSSTQTNPVGSVMLGMIGEGKTRGQVAILDVAAANNQNCAAIWVSETEIPPEYVYYWLWSRYDETRRGSSGNNQPALNKSGVEVIPLPLPPVNEARTIVALLNAAFDQSSEQDAAITFALKQSTAQRKNILKAAFSGKLVPQDPNDEPASALLARIRAQRAETPNKTVAKRRKSSSAAAN